MAIPAVLAYNLCVRQNRTLGHELQNYSHELLIDTILQDQKTTQKAPAEVEVSKAQFAGGQA